MIIFKKVSLILLGVIILIFSRYSFAALEDAKNINKVYKNVTVGCTACHPQGDFKGLNKYGRDYKDAGRSIGAVKSIDTSDSDADGMANSEEIKAGTNPGDHTSK